MLTYRMDDRGEQSLYEYLYTCIKRDIETGKIAADEHMPSKRRFAEHLGVSVITVENAYAQLVAEGYLRAVERKGYYANRLAGAGARSRARSRERVAPKSAPSTLPAPPEPTGLVADFTGGSATGLFPYARWAHTLRTTLGEESEETLKGELDPLGSPRLRKAIAAYLRGFRGVQVDPDNVVVGAGSQVLYNLLVQLLGYDRRFAVEEPGYPRLTRIYETCGVRLSHIPLVEDGVDVAALRTSGADVLHCMPSHQYPTGIVTPVSRRYELLGWASEAPGRYIIEDDYDCEFRFTGKPIPSLQSIDASGRVIYANTFAKSLGPGFRMGYLVLPDELAAAFRAKLGFYTNTSSAIDQLVLARFIARGDYERYVNRLRTRYRNLRDHVIAAIKASAMGPHAELEQSDGGLHFVMRLDFGAGADKKVDEEFAAAALASGVRIAPLAAYMQRADGRVAALARHRFLVNFSGIDDAVVEPAVAALAAGFELCAPCRR